MANRLVILPRAEADIDDAYRWYEARRSGSGDRLLKRIRTRLNAIRRHPEACALMAEGCRRALLSQFPYAIFYQYAEKTVTVVAVFHCAQSPERWRKRLDS